MKKIILCTGGTGGHIFPMIALYEELKKNHKVKIITDKRALKFLKKEKGISIIPAESPYRKEGLLHLIKSVITIAISMIYSFFIIALFRPNVIVGSGGYVSFPLLMIAKFFRINFFLYETNSVLGRVNQYFLPFCTKLLTGYENVKALPEKFKSKQSFIGQLVRPQFMYINEQRVFYGTNVEKKGAINILILGGSQGAEIFGKTLPERFRSLMEKNVTLSINQQVKEEQLERLSLFYEKFTQKQNLRDKDYFNFLLFTFSNKVDDFIKKADLVICRSGSSTLSELANANKPFIAVPLKNSLDNHQYYNAKYYFDRGCCWLVEDNQDLGFKIERIIEQVYSARLLLQNKIENLVKLRRGSPLNNFINQIT